MPIETSATSKATILIVLLLAPIVLVIALLVLMPFVGLIAPDLRVPVWVGRQGVGIHRAGGPVLLWPKAGCIEALKGFFPPYDLLQIDLNCTSAGNSNNQSRFSMKIHGQEKGITPASVAAETEDSMPERLGQMEIQDFAASGYRGIAFAIGNQSTPQEEYLTAGRLTPIDVDAPVPLLKCILFWKSERGSSHVTNGSCYGFGAYRDVIFDVRLNVSPNSTERAASSLIRTALNGMLMHDVEGNGSP